MRDILKRLLYFLTSLVFTNVCLADTSFETFFVDSTMRVDYYHTGIYKSDIFSLDQIHIEREWPSSKTNLIDTLNLGKYLVKVFDLKTNQLIYSRGFCTIFGEWQTTEEAKKGVYRTFHESVRFPLPKREVQLVISVRNDENVFIDKFSTVIDPESRFVNREKSQFPLQVKKTIDHGPCQSKVDLLILGDGYTKRELEKFNQDTEHMVDKLFSVSPFKERITDFNIWTIHSISQDSGIDEPRKEKWRQTILGATFNSLDSPRYVLTTQNKQLREISALVPYDFIAILVNSDRYGGGGIFNWFTTCYTGIQDREHQPGWWADYVFVHELGHSMAGLGDEYYSSSVAYLDFYPQNVEPWEPNVTALLDEENVKWQEFMTTGAPIPTFWEKARFDSLNQKALESYSNKEKYNQYKQEMQEILDDPSYPSVGAFEGSGYASEGLYRPSVDCIMFSKTVKGFCPVCSAAIERMIDFTIE
ncbi:peptidase M64 [candidate division KSB1 bacterium]|nr:peptidase M64 [candidate division KSB1 bacterium]